MRCTWMLLALIVKAAPAAAQAPSPDSQIAQTAIAEIRQLRQDLRNTAATIQRAQILIFCLQSQAAILDKTAQRLDQARENCKQAQAQQCQVEQTDAEDQFRAEQAKMNQLSDQLDQFDQVLAGFGSK
jgi:chromosome segregation ATPase